MPQPARTSTEEIIRTAWELVEQEGGADKLSLKQLADAVGIRAPSLYNHVASKDDLIRAINERSEVQLFAAMASADHKGSAAERLKAQIHAYRAYALAHPVTYALAFTTREPAARPDPAAQEQAVLPLQALVSEITGTEPSLTALRSLLALVHGFVMLEIHEQLRRGGSLDEAFTQSVDALLRGWSR